MNIHIFIFLKVAWLPLILFIFYYILIYLVGVKDKGVLLNVLLSLFFYLYLYVNYFYRSVSIGLLELILPIKGVLCFEKFPD
jgi:hypothetical protein